MNNNLSGLNVLRTAKAVYTSRKHEIEAELMRIDQKLIEEDWKDWNGIDADLFSKMEDLRNEFLVIRNFFKSFCDALGVAGMYSETELTLMERPVCEISPN